MYSMYLIVIVKVVELHTNSRGFDEPDQSEFIASYHSLNRDICCFTILGSLFTLFSTSDFFG